jgi:hypothetical protein
MGQVLKLMRPPFYPNTGTTSAAQRKRQALGGSRPSRLLTRTYATKPSRNWKALAESPARMVGQPARLPERWQKKDAPANPPNLIFGNINHAESATYFLS